MRRNVVIGIIALVVLGTLASVLSLGSKTGAIVGSTGNGGAPAYSLRAMGDSAPGGGPLTVPEMPVGAPAAASTAGASRGGGSAEASLNRADVATIVMRLVELPAADLGSGWSASETLQEALAALARFGERVGTVVIWAAIFSPVYGIPILAAWWMLRQRTERRPA